MKNQTIYLAFSTILGVLSASPALQAAGLTASDGVSGDRFGYFVSQSGNIGLIGAYQDGIGSNSRQGSAYVFRSLDTATGTITESVKLTASNGITDSRLGYSVSQFGSSGLVGTWDTSSGGGTQTQGSAYLYRNLDTASGNITETARLTATGRFAWGFGYSVSLSGTIGLVGANYSDSAYVFRNLDTATGTINENIKLTPSDGNGNNFGNSVSLSGNIGLIGAWIANNGSVSGGAAYVFRNLNTANGTINQNVKLVASDSANNDQFGRSVSLSGSNGLVGSDRDDIGSNFKQGSAYLFRNLDTATGTINQNVKLTASDGTSNANFGNSVSLSGSDALVGANNAKIGANGSPGAVYLFCNLDGASTAVSQNLKITASDGLTPDSFGSSVSLDGDNFIIGAIGAGVTASTGKAYTGTVSSITTLNNGATNRTIDGISFISQDDWIVGQSTSANKVTLNATNTANVTATSKGVYIGKNTGSNNNKLVVSGALTATQVTVSSTTGSTGNTLEVTATGSLAASNITVNSGGTLLLSGSNTVTDRIATTAAITVASGGKLSTSGLKEGLSASGSTAGIGILTLTGGSTVDFATGANGSTILASSGIVSESGLITILNWSGAARLDSGDATYDRLLFINNPGFTASQLAQFAFYNDSNVAYAIGANLITYNGFYEVVPVPEPATIIGGLVLSGLVGYQTFRHSKTN